MSATTPTDETNVDDQEAPSEKRPSVGDVAVEAPPSSRREIELIPRGNPPRRRSGIALLLGGGVPAFLLVAKNGQNGWAIPLGFVFILVCACGVMDLLGTFDDDEARVLTRTTLGSLARPFALLVGFALAFGGTLMMAQAGMLPGWLASILVTGTFLGGVAGTFAFGRALGPWSKDEVGIDRPLFRRHGFWVLAIGAALYFPGLGMFSLWDPWETHYGEVAREILARDDWISLWWAQDGWFWSKPVLNFWIQSLAMGSFGTHFQPDQMLIGANGLASAHPEWVVRTPNVLMTLGAMYLLYKGVAKVFGRRAGLLGALVLATMPDWFFLAHQTMTDMPFVAAMTAAMGLLLFGLNTDADAPVPVYEVSAFHRKWRLSLWHVVFGAVLVCALPQILYLLSRNVELVVFGNGPKGFRLHWDEFRSGSAGNCGLPGNEQCVTTYPASVGKAGNANTIGGMFVHFFGGMEPAFQAILWALVVGGLLYVNWGERRGRRLLYIAAWLAAAVATMAKGPAGFGLPMICAFAYVATKKRWGELLRLEMLSGLLIILAVSMPWYVAMYVRHGSPFTDRLIFHDMFNRAFSHVHDTNEGDDTGIRYYMWQLGYALFPWTGFAPLGLSWWLRRSDSDRERSSGATGATGDASVLLAMWFLFAFALFTFMGTKFHHYIFPAVPPAAMLIGVVLDDLLGKGSEQGQTTGSRIAYVFGLAVAAGALVYGVARAIPATWIGGKGVTSPLFAAICAGVGIVLLVLLRGSGRDASLGQADRARRHEDLMLAGAAVAAGALLVLVGRDLVIKPDGADQPGAIRLLQLFTYNYKRPWPESLDFAAPLAGFTVVGAALSIGLAVRAIRRHMALAFCAFAFVWAVWGLDVYMMDVSPHWGQHEVIEAYYRDRKSPDELLVAYQMNWKGENFYTSNRIPAFVSSGATFQTWLKGQKEKGARVMYFITEHSRTGGLRGEVGAKSYKELTDKALCNKFILVRAEL